jgi:tetratricopeptide (TPR) repeat protein
MHRIRISLLFGCAALVTGGARAQSPDYAAASEMYRAQIRVNPADPGAHVNLGVALVHLGRYDEAIQEYETAEKLLPGDPRIGVNTALAYQKSGRVREAAQRFSELHKSFPSENKITLLLADCDLQLGENQQVVDLLEPMQAANADDLGFAYMLGTALIRMQHIQQGQVFLDRILRNGDTPEARFLLGTRMFESGDYPAAVKQLAAAADLNPNLPELQSYYGRALLATGDPDAASSAFRKELALNPGDYAANLGLGQILAARKQCSEATPYLERAITRQTLSAAALIALGQCDSAVGKYPAARTHLEAALQVSPDSIEAHRALIIVYDRLQLKSLSAKEQARVRKLESIARASEPGPKLNDAAPEFALAEATSGKTIRLSDLRQGAGAVLIFGSYSCPNFRSSAEDLKRLQLRYGTHIPFLLVYIREAHATDQWQSTRNQREAVELTPAANIRDKQQHAAMCSRQLHLNFPAVVDGMDGAVENAYAAWPSRLYIIDRAGRIRYLTRLSEQDFHAEEVESAIRQLQTTPEDSRED